MKRAGNRRLQFAVAAVLGLMPMVAAVAQERHEARMSAPAQRPEEMQQGPRGYQRIERPREVQNRPQTFDRQQYRHNFKAAHTFGIGPYHAPPGWQYRRWHYGETLPAVFWAADYRLADFWLFGLDIPPVGYEWVRYGDDALLVSMDNGEIVQVVYGIFV